MEQVREFSRVLAAAAQASAAASHLVEQAYEGGDPVDLLLLETIEKLLDAAKLTIDLCHADLGGDVGQIYAAIVKYLEGWAG